MPQHTTYSLNRESTDGRGLVMNTSSLGAVIGFGTAFTTLIEPGTMPEISWSLFQTITLISFLGMGLGAGIGLTLAAYFATFVVRKYSTKTGEVLPRRAQATGGVSPTLAKRKNLFGVGEMNYGT